MSLGIQRSSIDFAEAKWEEAETKSSSSTIPIVFSPEDCLQVVAFSWMHKPIFPGFFMKLLAALVESWKKGKLPFLVKDEKNIHELKGKELLHRMHEVGTLVQMSNINGDEVILMGHRRIQISKMVEKYPLLVKVEHLKEKPHGKYDDVIKAMSLEVS